MNDNIDLKGTPNKTSAVAPAGDDTASDVAAQAKSLFDRAQETIEGAIETTIEAVKENPLAAAAIAGGVVAAAAGAAYGVSALRKDEPATKSKAKPAGSAKN